MIFFVYNFARKCQSHWRKNFLPHVRYVATIPCESVRHKSNTFHTILALCAFTETSIDETNKRQQKVRNSKFMFKMSTIHANTCIQTTTPLRNRCRDDGVVRHAGTVSGQVGQEKYGGHFHYFLMTTALYKL